MMGVTVIARRAKGSTKRRRGDTIPVAVLGLAAHFELAMTM
jgi:hypothetical protein